MKSLRPCSMCGCDPCESPGWCRAQARWEAEEPDTADEALPADPVEAEVEDADTDTERE